MPSPSDVLICATVTDILNKVLEGRFVCHKPEDAIPYWITTEEDPATRGCMVATVRGTIMKEAIRKGYLQRGGKRGSGKGRVIFYTITARGRALIGAPQEEQKESPPSPKKVGKKLIKKVGKKGGKKLGKKVPKKK